MLDALVSLFCRSNVTAETMWEGGWLLRQLLPYSEAEFNSGHLKLLNVSFPIIRLSISHIFELHASYSFSAPNKNTIISLLLPLFTCRILTENVLVLLLMKLMEFGLIY